VLVSLALVLVEAELPVLPKPESVVKSALDWERAEGAGKLACAAARTAASAAEVDVVGFKKGLVSGALALFWGEPVLVSLVLVLVEAELPVLPEPESVVKSALDWERAEVAEELACAAEADVVGFKKGLVSGALALF